MTLIHAKNFLPAAGLIAANPPASVTVVRWFDKITSPFDDLYKLCTFAYNNNKGTLIQPDSEE